MGIFTWLADKQSSHWVPGDIRDRWEYTTLARGLRNGDEDAWKELFKVQGRSGLGAITILPLAKLMAEATADLMVGERPLFRTAEPDDQQNLDRIVWENDLVSQLHSAIMASSSEGGIYIKVLASDATPRSRRSPIIQFINEENVIPVFIGEELVEATIVTEYAHPRDGMVFRLLEIHAPGSVTYQLRECKDVGSSRGNEVPLATLEATKDLRPLRLEGELADMMLIDYIRNQNDPEGTPYGISDYQGLDGLFADACEAHTVSQEALRASLPWEFVPKSMEKDARKLQRRIMTYDDKHKQMGADKPNVESVQHDFKGTEFQNHVKGIVELVAMAGGHSMSLLQGDVSGGANSGLAVKLKMVRSSLKAAGKAHRYELALSRVLRNASILDAQQIGRKPANHWTDATSLVAVQFMDGLPTDEQQQATTLAAKVAAGIISKKQAIRELHPTWNDEQVQEELDAIDNEASDPGFAAALNRAITNPLAPAPADPAAQG